MRPLPCLLFAAKVIGQPPQLLPFLRIKFDFSLSLTTSGLTLKPITFMIHAGELRHDDAASMASAWVWMPAYRAYQPRPK